MENPADYQYDIDVAEVAELWRRGSVVGSWLLKILPLLYYAAIEDIASSMGVSDSGEGRWTVHAAVDLGVPSPVISSALWARFESRRLGAFAVGFEWNREQCLEDMMLGNALTWTGNTTLYYPQYNWDTKR